MQLCLAINLQTAKGIRLTISESFLLRANEAFLNTCALTTILSDTIAQCSPEV